MDTSEVPETLAWNPASPKAPTLLCLSGGDYSRTNENKAFRALVLGGRAAVSPVLRARTVILQSGRASRRRVTSVIDEPHLSSNPRTGRQPGHRANLRRAPE